MRLWLAPRRPIPACSQLRQVAMQTRVHTDIVLLTDKCTLLCCCYFETKKQHIQLCWPLDPCHQLKPCDCVHLQTSAIFMQQLYQVSSLKSEVNEYGKLILIGWKTNWLHSRSICHLQDTRYAVHLLTMNSNQLRLQQWHWKAGPLIPSYVAGGNFPLSFPSPSLRQGIEPSVGWAPKWRGSWGISRKFLKI